MVTDPNLTRMLNDAARGAPGAADRLLPVIYDELRRMASRQVSGDAATVEPTALVHEAWLRIAGDDEVAWNHRGHFFGSAAQAMRRILVEHARARSAHKRGGGARPEALEELPFVVPDADQVLDLEAALAKLEAERPREARIVGSGAKHRKTSIKNSRSTAPGG